MRDYLIYKNMENKFDFELDQNDLVVKKINGNQVNFKIGELFGFENPVMEFEDAEFLNQIHQTDLITKDVLAGAEDWFNINYSAKDDLIGSDNYLTGPKPGFFVIINSSGDVVDHLSSSSNMEEVEELVDYLNCNFPNNAPHSCWQCNGSFKQVIF